MLSKTNQTSFNWTLRLDANRNYGKTFVITITTGQAEGGDRSSTRPSRLRGHGDVWRKTTTGAPSSPIAPSPLLLPTIWYNPLPPNPVPIHPSQCENRSFPTTNNSPRALCNFSSKSCLLLSILRDTPLTLNFPSCHLIMKCWCFLNVINSSCLNFCRVALPRNGHFTPSGISCLQRWPLSAQPWFPPLCGMRCHSNTSSLVSS